MTIYDITLTISNDLPVWPGTRALDLDFVSVEWERYDLVIPQGGGGIGRVRFKRDGGSSA